MIDWIYKCGNEWHYCKDGFCEKYNQLKENHKRPAVEMSNEWKEKTGKDWKPGAIRYKYHKLTDVSKTNSYEKQNYETCAISDLNWLIERGYKFGAIYVDPPWQYSNQATRAATDNHYKTLSIEEIAEHPIEKLSLENSHLHLWTTNAFLSDALRLIEYWGFVFKSCFVWAKTQMGIGNYWRVSHEFLLLGVRGKCPFHEKHHKSWLELDRTKHSRKPEEVAQIIEKVSSGPYVELFGRRWRPNWIVWGNEIERDLFYDSVSGPR